MAKKYKGRYVAQVEIDFDVDAERPNILPFAEIKRRISEGITPELEELIIYEIVARDGTVKVTQQYADFYEVEETDGNN